MEDIFKRESPQSTMPAEMDNYEEIQNLLEINQSAPVPPGNPLAQELAAIATEVKSIEAIRKSQAITITQLRAKLKQAEEDITRKDWQLKESATKLIEQQEALTNVREEKVKLEKELEEEKGRRTAAEGSLSKLRDLVKTAQSILTTEDSASSVDETPSGSNNLTKTNELSSTASSNLKNWKDGRKKGNYEVTRTKLQDQHLSKRLSSNKAPQVSNIAEMKALEGSSSSINTRKRLLKRRSIKTVEQRMDWTACTDSSTNNRNNGKHFRDITKRHLGFQCVCGLEFITRRELNSHIQQFGSVYTEVDVLERAGREHHQEEVKAKILKKVEGDISHGIGSMPLHCLCGSVFSKISSLRLHILRHRFGKRFSCKVCGKLYRDTWELRNHYRVSHNLQHVIVGAGCSKCGSTFGSKVELFQHQKKSHTMLRYV